MAMQIISDSVPKLAVKRLLMIAVNSNKIIRIKVIVAVDSNRLV